MILTRSSHISLIAAIVLFSMLPAVSALADEPTVLVQPEAESSLSELIKNILADTNYNFERFRGLDDCGDKQTYIASRDLLGRYADAPEQHEETLRNYILNNKAQCNCVRAIIGKNFDILVDTVRSDMSQVPCP